jgi:hypothetical protein
VTVSPFEAVKYIADIEPVHEVSIVGSAEAEFWSRRLAAIGLTPSIVDGRAQVVLSAMASQFRGIRFRELCISVIAKVRGAESSGEALFLLQAFNSSRLFTFCERVFFSTPYLHARLEVSVNGLASVDLSEGATTLLRARFSSETRKPLRTSHDCFEGPIFLPPSSPPDVRELKFFRARIAGATTVWTFDPARDVVEFPAEGGHDVFQPLHDSGFAVREWHLRPKANHARSKTFRCQTDGRR